MNHKYKKMKHIKLFTILLGLLVSIGYSADSFAQATPFAQIQVGQKSYHVTFRLDRTNHEAYVAFYGPAMRRGTDVSVNIYQNSNGALIQQEVVTTFGGGKFEKFSLDGLDSGEYTVIVSGDKYSLSQPFTWF